MYSSLQGGQPPPPTVISLQHNKKLWAFFYLYFNHSENIKSWWQSVSVTGLVWDFNSRIVVLRTSQRSAGCSARRWAGCTGCRAGEGTHKPLFARAPLDAVPCRDSHRGNPCRHRTATLCPPGYRRARPVPATPHRFLPSVKIRV